MKCPYRKQIKTTINGSSNKIKEVDFMECVKEECPFWVATVFSANDYKWKYGCGKAKKECS